MKTLFALTLLVCAGIGVAAQQPTPSPSPVSAQRTFHAHRPIKRGIAAPAPQPVNAPASDYFVGEAKVNITKDETVIRLAMAQHGSVLIELPANDGPRYIIPGDPEMATVDEKALERNKRAIVVRPGTLFVTPPPNHKVRTPAATVTAQMRSGLVVTFLFYPVEDLAQNVHRCVLSYNRDEVVARRRAAGLPVNLDANASQERRDSTGQSTAPTSIWVEETDGSRPSEKASESKTAVTNNESGAKEVEAPKAVPSPTTSVTPANVKTSEADEKLKAAMVETLARAAKTPKQFTKWTKPLHGLALSILPPIDTNPAIQLLTLAVKNKGRENLKLVSTTPDLFVEMRDEQDKPINLESVRKLHVETSDASGEIRPGKTVYLVIAYVSPVLGSRQQLKVTVGQTSAADDPASIAVAKSER